MGVFNSLLTLSLALVVANAADNPPSSRREAQQAAAQAGGASFSTDLVFEPGSSNLTADARRELTDMLDTARKNGAVKEVKILAWSDHEYPANGKEKLDGEQRKLADNRAFEVKGVIVDKAPGVQINTYNMAEHSGTLDQIYKAPTDKNLKRKVEKAGLTDPTSGQNPPRASHALVLFILK